MTDPAVVDRIAEVSAAHRMGTEMTFYRNGTCKLPRCRCGKSMHPNAHPRHLAEAIAKVVRPRIETQAELDTLTHGSLVVHEYTSAAGWSLNEVWERRNDDWYCLAAPLSPPSQTYGSPTLPARLLYTPGDTE